MKGGFIATSIILLLLLCPTVYSQKEIPSSDFNMYYIQPIKFYNDLSRFDVTEDLRFSHPEYFKFNHSKKELLISQLEQSPVFEVDRNDSKLISFHVKGNDLYELYIYPSAFVAKYTSSLKKRGYNTTFDKQHHRHNFEQFLKSNVSGNIPFITPPFTTSDNPEVFRPQMIITVKLDTTNRSFVDSYKETLGVETYMEDVQKLRENRMFIFKDIDPYNKADRILVVYPHTIPKEDLVPVINLVGYIHPYADDQFKIIEGKLLTQYIELTRFRIALTSNNISEIDKTITELESSINNLNRLNFLEVKELETLINNEENLLEIVQNYRGDNLFYKIYYEEIKDHNDFFGRDVKNLKIRIQNLKADYESLQFQLQARADFLEQLAKMDTQIKGAIRAAVLAAIGLILTVFFEYRRDINQTPIFKKIEVYLDELIKQNKNSRLSSTLEKIKELIKDLKSERNKELSPKLACPYCDHEPFTYKKSYDKHVEDHFKMKSQ